MFFKKLGHMTEMADRHFIKMPQGLLAVILLKNSFVPDGADMQATNQAENLLKHSDEITFALSSFSTGVHRGENAQQMG